MALCVAIINTASKSATGAASHHQHILPCGVCPFPLAALCAAIALYDIARVVRSGFHFFIKADTPRLPILCLHLTLLAAFNVAALFARLHSSLHRTITAAISHAE